MVTASASQARIAASIWPRVFPPTSRPRTWTPGLALPCSWSTRATPTDTAASSNTPTTIAARLTETVKQRPRPSQSSVRRQDELESRAVGGRILVEELPAVRLGVRLRDREPEAGSRRRSRRPSAREAVEQPRHECRGDAVAVILDRETEMPVVLNGADGDRRASVPKRVRHEVADDPVERRRVDVRLEILGHVHDHFVMTVPCDRAHELRDPLADRQRTAIDRDRLRLET